MNFLGTHRPIWLAELDPPWWDEPTSVTCMGNFQYGQSLQNAVISSLLGTQQNNIKVDALLKVIEVVVAEQNWKKWFTS